MNLTDEYTEVVSRGMRSLDRIKKNFLYSTPTEVLIDELKSRDVKLYNGHEVAEILAELFGNFCACNYNDNDTWLPEYCDFGKSSVCPNPAGVACWEQYMKHLDEKPKWYDPIAAN